MMSTKGTPRSERKRVATSSQERRRKEPRQTVAVQTPPARLSTLEDPPPDALCSAFRKDIFPLLTKITALRAGRYVLPNGTVLGTEDDARRWLCAHGLPEDDTSSLSTQEQSVLMQWAFCANLKRSDWRHSGGPLTFPHSDICQILAKVGLTADADGRLATARMHFCNLEHVRTQLRQKGPTTVLPRSLYVSALSEEERARLRMWAAQPSVAVAHVVVSPDTVADLEPRLVRSQTDTTPIATGSTCADTSLSMSDTRVAATSPLRNHDTKGESMLFEQTGHRNFRANIFPQLRKIFHYSNCTYSWRGKEVGSEVDARRWILRHGVPLVGLTDENVAMLHTWASYAYVKLSDFNHLVTQYSDNQIEQLLVHKLQVQCQEDGTFATRRANLGCLEQVARLLCTQGSGAIHRSAFTRLTEEERANVRLWAARSNCRTVVVFTETEESNEQVAAPLKADDSPAEIESPVRPAETRVAVGTERQGGLFLSTAAREHVVVSPAEEGHGEPRRASVGLWGLVGRIFSRK
jgi:hypothetical protein